MNNTWTSCTIEGFVTHDPESRTTKTGKTVTSFELAIQHYTKPGEPPRVSFIAVEDWNNKVQVKKAQRVMVSGSLRQDRWENELGKIESRLKILSNDIEVKS